MRPRSARRFEGLTAVEMLVAVSIIGVAMAVLVPTFVRHLRTSKTAEATEALQSIDRRVQAYYQRRHAAGRRCLPKPAGPTPATGSPAPVSVDFFDAEQPGHAVWRALDYQPDGPIRFRYSFEPVAADCLLEGTHLWTLRAEGDLDGDGKYSRFERSSGINEDGLLGPVGVFHIYRRTE